MPEYLQETRETVAYHGHVHRPKPRVPADAEALHASLNQSAPVQYLANLQRAANGSPRFAMQRQSAGLLSANAAARTPRPDAPPNRLRPIGTQPVAQTQLVIQRHPTEEELANLRRRVGESIDSFTFTTRPDGHEIAIGPRHTFLLIRRIDGGIEWREIPNAGGGGHGFFGRLGDNPPTLAETGAATQERQILAAAPTELFREFTFVADQASQGRRANNNTVMGRHFMGDLMPAEGMPASAYAQTPDCEWLHLQGHGLGGGETPDNLFAGTNGANSEMAAIEGAIQALQAVYGDRVVVQGRILPDRPWSQGNLDVCRRIAATLTFPDAGRRETAAAAIATRESQKAGLIEFHVVVDGVTVLERQVLPFQPQRFDEAQFALLNQRARDAIRGRQRRIEFVSATTPDGGGGGGGDAMDTDGTG